MSQIQLHSPFIIGPGLRPTLRIGKGFVSMEYAIRRCSSDGRTVYRYYINCGDGKRPIIGNDLKSGCHGGTLQDGFSSLLSFLGAEAEAWHGLDPVADRKSEKRGDNAGMFPARAARFAIENSDEIGVLSYEIDESKTPLIAEVPSEYADLSVRKIDWSNPSTPCKQSLQSTFPQPASVRHESKPRATAAASLRPAAVYPTATSAARARTSVRPGCCANGSRRRTP